MKKLLVFCIALLGIVFMAGCAIQSTKTSSALMKDLIVKINPTATVENYKIFEEIKSPDSTKTAVLFGLDTEECCSEPIGIFINNQGVLGNEYDILKGALEHLYLENVKWQDNDTVLYDSVIADEGGKQATQKSITTTPVETISETTYQNDKYGFSFNYDPEKYSVAESRSRSGATGDESDLIRMTAIGESCPAVDIFISTATLEQELNDLEFRISGDTVQTTVDGISATKRSGDITDNLPPCGSEKTEVVFEHEDNVFVITAFKNWESSLDELLKSIQKTEIINCGQDYIADVVIIGGVDVIKRITELKTMQYESWGEKCNYYAKGNQLGIDQKVDDTGKIFTISLLDKIDKDYQYIASYKIDLNQNILFQHNEMDGSYSKLGDWK